MDADYTMGSFYWREAIPSMDALAGAKEYELKQGAGHSITVIELYSGSGFHVCIYPERGMDIGETYYKGVPIAFVSKAGIKNPQHIAQTDFSRYFFGGLVTTCGLDNVGGSCEVDGEYYPGHGRLNLTPAYQYGIETYWEGSNYWIEVKGKVRMAALFGENLVFQRSIRMKAGESRVIIHDQIQNEGYVRTGYMLLYHCNFGYPIVSADSQVITNHRNVEYLDQQSRELGRNHQDLSRPEPGARQSAFVLSNPSEERVKAQIWNPKMQMGVSLECNHSQLNQFCEWVNLKSQDYAVGLEPAKNLPEGRNNAVEKDHLTWIQPQEIQETELEIAVISL